MSTEGSCELVIEPSMTPQEQLDPTQVDAVGDDNHQLKPRSLSLYANVESNSIGLAPQTSTEEVPSIYQHPEETEVECQDISVEVVAPLPADTTSTARACSRAPSDLEHALEQQNSPQSMIEFMDEIAGAGITSLMLTTSVESVKIEFDAVVNELKKDAEQAEPAHETKKSSKSSKSPNTEHTEHSEAEGLPGLEARERTKMMINLLEKFVKWNIELRSWRWMQVFVPIFAAIHWIGKRHVNFTLAPIFLYVDPRYYVLGIMMALYPSFAAGIGSFAKDALMIPRPKWLLNLPEWIKNSSEYAIEKSFSTPSNHSVVYGGVATVMSLYFGLDWKTLIISALIILITMLSRMYLMVHYAHDVISGALLAVVICTGLYHFDVVAVDTLLQQRNDGLGKWRFSMIWGVGLVVCNVALCVLHRFFVVPRLPNTKILEWYCKNSGFEARNHVFLRFPTKSWYFIAYMAVASVSVDMLCNVSGFDILDGKLMYGELTVNISSICWLASCFNFLVLKVMKAAESREFIHKRKQLFRMLCYSFVSLFTFYLLPMFFVKIVHESCCLE